ncbi:MAG: DUF1330 domain-containing protein [Pseudomonadales bacterium]|nr:DUF1330 domain-containing protein [Pseudomonadales bacterium]
MEDKKSFLVINAIVNKQNMAELQEYLGRVMQIFGKNGGKPVGRHKTIEQLSGEDSFEMIAIIEFADSGVINEMAKGEEFMALSDMRSRVP